MEGRSKETTETKENEKKNEANRLKHKIPSKRPNVSTCPSKKRHKKKEKGDRFIPNRNGMNIEKAINDTSASNAEECEEDRKNSQEKSDEEKNESSAVDFCTSEAIKQALQIDLLGESDTSNGSKSSNKSDERILAFKNKAPLPSEDHINSLKVLYSQAPGGIRSIAQTAKLSRHVSSMPEKMLDAPGLLDDYYLNLLSWGQNNIVAIALGSDVYLWNPKSGKIIEIPAVEEENEYVSSVNFTNEGGAHIAIGTSTGLVQLWDITTQKKLRKMRGHAGRIGVLNWNKHVVSSGGRDGNILNHDVRIGQHIVATYTGHVQEVCSLKWSSSGRTLASGGNDNQVNLWEGSTSEGFERTTPRVTINEHQAAVKALGWCPFEHNVLATGAGTADRTIKFFNAMNGTLLNSVDTGTQVCAIEWSRTEKELLSSHGYTTNSLCLWKYPSMTKVKELRGHTKRVLYLAQSPGGEMVVSGAADETLRFWNVFAPKATKTIKEVPSKLYRSSRAIR